MNAALERLREIRRDEEKAVSTESSPKSPKSPDMTLAEFAGSGRQVVIYSHVLGCELVLAAGNARVPSTEARPVYRARELAAIWEPGGKISADGLRLLHETKTRFGAEVMEESSQPRLFVDK